MDSSQYVRVAVNISPLISSELLIGWTDCITVVPGEPQVEIGSHSFTYDHVHGSTGSPSSAIFNDCVAPLVDALFRGYNATVLAYGRIFKEEVFDLLDQNSSALRKGGRVRAAEAVGPARVPLQIKETVHGGIILPGLTEAEVKTKEEIAFYLSRSCLSRATGSTNMNSRFRVVAAATVDNISLKLSQGDHGDAKQLDLVWLLMLRVLLEALLALVNGCSQIAGGSPLSVVVVARPDFGG